MSNDTKNRVSDEDLLDELQRTREELLALKAARVAYALEFPLDADGLPDVENVHQNIRNLKRQLSEEATKNKIDREEDLAMMRSLAQRVVIAANEEAALRKSHDALVKALEDETSLYRNYSPSCQKNQMKDCKCDTCRLERSNAVLEAAKNVTG